MSRHDGASKDLWFLIDWDGSDCETCGWNYDRLEVEVALKDGKPCEFGYSVDFSVGCYGGLRVHDATLKGALDALREVGEYGIFNERRRELDGIVAELKKMAAVPC